MKRRTGIFVTFEGIDGCGKTTQARLAYTYIRKAGYPVVLVREPGGVPASERIRKVLLDRRLEIHPVGELFLYQAARVQVTTDVILPALAQGKIVICDRYFDSTTAYQGFGRGLDLTLVKRLNVAGSLGLTPDKTFIFDVDYETSLGRRNAVPDRLENESRLFFKRVRTGFRSLARLRRVVMLDGRKDIAGLHEEVKEKLDRLIRQRKISASR